MNKKYYIYFKCDNCKVDCKTTKYRYALQSIHLCRKCSIQKTWKNKTKDELNIIKEKTKKTCIKKYGVDNPAKNENIKKKAAKTCMEKYGVSSILKLESIHTKGIKAASKKSARDKAKSRTNYKEVWKNAMKTYKDRTGFDHPMHNPDVKNKMIIDYGEIGRVAKYKKDNKLFDSYWEIALYQYLTDNNVNFEFHPKKTFEYKTNDGKLHLYVPDFKINNIFYEIKGTQFFNKEGQPYNMYTHKFWYEKYNCMIKNHIVILKEEDLSQILCLYKRKQFEKFKI